MSICQSVIKQEINLYIYIYNQSYYIIYIIIISIYYIAYNVNQDIIYYNEIIWKIKIQNRQYVHIWKIKIENFGDIAY